MLKMKKFLFPVLMIIAAVFSNFSPSINASAQSNATSDISIVIGFSAQEKIDATYRLVEAGKGTVAPLSALELEESTVYTVGGGVTVVTIPLHEEYSLPSNITVFFDEDNKVLQTNEMLVTKNDLGNFQVSTYLNGTLVNSQDSGLAYMTDEELLAEEPTIQPTGFKEIAGCLGGVLGVGGTAAYIIAVACGGSCATPTPVTAGICAACIGAYATIGGASIAGVVACFALL